MQLLKFKSELSPPAVHATELAQLVKISLQHPESYTHRFTQNRWDTLPGGRTEVMSAEVVDILSLRDRLLTAALERFNNCPSEVLQSASGGADVLSPLPACVWFQSLSRCPTAPQLGWTSSSTSSTGAAGECPRGDVHVLVLTSC